MKGWVGVIEIGQKMRGKKMDKIGREYSQFKNELKENYDFLGKEKCIEEIGELKAFRILAAQIKKNELWRREMLFWKINDRILAVEEKTPVVFEIIKLENINE